jgi:hypothetical protein
MSLPGMGEGGGGCWQAGKATRWGWGPTVVVLTRRGLSLDPYKHKSHKYKSRNFLSLTAR